MPKKPKRKVKNTRKPKRPNNGDNNNHDRDDTSDSDVDPDDVTIEELDRPIKSEKDVNEYRVAKLPNGIVVLLVSCPGALASESIPNMDRGLRCLCLDDWLEKFMNTRKASIYLTIGTGCFSDPRHVPGVSNFVSGSILSNSKKYPDMDDNLSLFVIDCGGENRRVDRGDTTTFAIDVPEIHFGEMMDRFVHCFISPLMERKRINDLREDFQATYIDKVMDREFMEERGKERLFANLLSARHPVKTLGPNNPKGLIGLSEDQVYKEVVKFRDRHYSAHRMTLVLKAKQPLDTLEMYAKKYFSKIPNNRQAPRDLSQYNFANSFDSPKSRKIYTMKPTRKRETYALELLWSLPPSHWLYRSKPRDYIAALLQHEGEGSLISYLRMKNWCTKIVIGDINNDFAENSIYCLFSVKILLTKEGHNDYKNILDVLFSYINMLRRTEPQERIFDELRKIEDAKFRFGRNFESVEILEDISINMHKYPPIDYLAGKYLYLEYDYVSLKTCIDLLAPERSMIVMYDKDFKYSETDTTSTEQDSDEQLKFHTSTDVPDDWINHWKKIEPMPCFHLPKSNSYLCDDFTLIPLMKNPPKYPVKIHKDSLSEVWYKPDSTFRLPQCFIHIHYVSPLPLADPENAAMVDLFAEALKRVMAKELYPAIYAGLKYEIKSSEIGLVVQAHGFNQKLPHVVEAISKYVAKCSKLVNADLFQRIKLKQEKKYRESLQDTSNLCEELRLSIAKLVHWTSLDKQNVLSSIKFYDFQRFLERFVDRVYLQFLIQGNILETGAMEIMRNCIKLTNNKPLLVNNVPRLRFHELPRGEHFCRVKSFDQNTVVGKVMNYYQIAETTSHRLSVMIDLLIMILTDPEFEDLRDYENFYEKFVGNKFTRGIFGYSLSSVEEIPLFGNIKPSDFEKIDDIEDNIEMYRKNWNLTVKSMSVNDMIAIKKALLTVKKRPDPSLKCEVLRNWNEIMSGDYVFNRRELEVAAVNDLDIEDIRKWLAHLTTDSSKLRKLSVQVCSEEDIKNLSTAKTGQNARGFEPEYKNYDQHVITYFTDLPKDTKQKGDCYYITNIPKFKIGLKIFPIVKATNPPIQRKSKITVNQVKKSNEKIIAFQNDLSKLEYLNVS